MAKGFKLRLSRVLQICRPKHPPTYPQSPPRAGAHWLIPANPESLDVSFTSLPAPPPSTPDHSFIARHAASVRCGPCAGADSPPEYTWQKGGRWHEVSRRSRSQPGPRRKISGVSRFDDGDVETASPVVVRQGDRRMKQKKKSQAKGRMTSSVVGRSVASSDSGWFSSEGGSDNTGEDGDETDALLSTSRSFSADTLPESYRATRHAQEDRATKQKQKSPQEEEEDEDDDTDEDRIRRLSRYTSEGREEVAAGERRRGVVMRESVAVVKRSENPLDDFKRSMAEMIVEKRMFGAGDLEQLLQCFLSLNSRHYHGIIVEAFAEIWQVLFFDSHADTERRRAVSSSASAAAGDLLI